jgi:hypothetical protein
VRREVSVALCQPGTAVFPLLTDGAVMPESTLPDCLADLGRRQSFTLDGGRVHENVDTIVQAFKLVRRAA